MRDLEKHAVREIALSLLHDYVDVVDIRNDVNTFCQRLAHEGLPFVTKKLAQMGKAFDAALGSGIFTWDYGAFKRDPKSKVVPEFLRSLYTRVFDENGRLRDQPCYRAVRFIRTFCFLFYKLEMDVEWNEEEIMRKFEDNDDNVIVGSLKCDRLQNRLRHSFATVFSDFSFENLVPSHGPGVSSNVPRNAKWSYYPPNSAVIEKFGRRFFNHGLEAFECKKPVFSSRTTEGRLFELFCIGFARIFCEKVGPSPTAKMLLVPKDSRGPRVISCEPVEHMFAQQSIKDYMVQKLENYLKTAGRVNFTA